MPRTEKVKIGNFRMDVQGAAADYLDQFNTNNKIFEPRDIKGGEEDIAIDRFVEAMHPSEAEKQKKLREVVHLTNRLHRILRQYAIVTAAIRKRDKKTGEVTINMDHANSNTLLRLSEELHPLHNDFDNVMKNFPDTSLVEAHPTAGSECPVGKRCYLTSWRFDLSSTSPYKSLLEELFELMDILTRVTLGWAIYFEGY